MNNEHLKDVLIELQNIYEESKSNKDKRMIKKLIIKLYTSSELDGVYISNKLLDELCDELKKAIHYDECCSRERTEKWKYS